MKISLAWIFDHLKGNRRDYKVADLINQLRSTTAEIDGVEHKRFSWERFYVGELRSLGEYATIRCPERKRSSDLPRRDDAQQGAWYLVVSDGATMRWATLQDLGAEREGLVPSIACPDGNETGVWREALEHEDWIIEVDNKSLTNRPDLWGHRGFAREVSVLLGLGLIPEEQLCVQKPIRHYDKKAPFIDLSAPSACSRFAGITLHKVVAQPTPLFIAHRLARLDAKPIDLFVDLTNYVMFDFGHPMHVFDAAKIQGGIVVREALPHESLELLDGEVIELTSQDCVVADEKGALSLAGIMGGRSSAVSRTTTQLFIEAAHFDPVAIRKSSAHLKRRTESSIRFEKNLDPLYNTVAITRYLALLDAYKISYQADEAVTSVGPLAKEATITVSHRFLVERIGTLITEGQVRSILIKLGFGVQIVEYPAAGLGYQITVPTFRGTRDVRIPEDIVEEVARFIGYDSLVPVLPTRPMKPFLVTEVLRRRAIKHYCAYALGMREIESYPLADESFIARLDVPREQLVTIQNPLSQNWIHFVTSLVPALLEAVGRNVVQEEEVRFFELNRSWRMGNGVVDERRVLAGIWYRRPHLDFYKGKQAVDSLLFSLALVPEWRKADTDVPCWFDAQRTAALYLGEALVGYAGMVKPDLLAKVAEQGEAFVFELDAASLLVEPSYEKPYCPPSKYQAISYDVSMFVPATLSVAQIEAAIALADVRIRDVALRDRFEKAEWGARRSITMRYLVQDDEKTLSKQDTDEIQKIVEDALIAQGVELR